MQDNSDHPDATAYRAVVRELIAKFGWILLSEDDLVELALRATPPEGTARSLEKLVIQQYTIALYEACRQSNDPDLRERGYSDLFRYLYRAAYNRWPDIAEDSAQRALEIVYQQIERCQNPITFLSFAMFKLLDAAKRERHRPGSNLPLEHVSQGTSAADYAEIVAPILERERLHTLLEAINRLQDERKQKVILFRFFGELSDEEISDRLGIKVGHVRVLRFNALKELRKDQRLRDYFRKATSEET